MNLINSVYNNRLDMYNIISDVMNINDLVTDERKIKLEKELENELSDLKNGIMSKGEFISYIFKKYNFGDVYYLINTYIAPVILIDEYPELPILNDIDFDEVPVVNDGLYYNNIKRSVSIPRIKDVKRIKKSRKYGFKR